MGDAATSVLAEQVAGELSYWAVRRISSLSRSCALGRVLIAAQLVERGAQVYATARRPESVDLDGVEVLALDISDPDAVAAAARVADDVNLLVNNAGIGGGALLGDLRAVRAVLDVNFWGTLSMARAFAPVLAANGGGSIVNIASSASWFVFPGSSAYVVSKAAVWSMSRALRQELAAHAGSSPRSISGPQTPI